eukprot:gene19132-25739_t
MLATRLLACAYRRLPGSRTQFVRATADTETGDTDSLLDPTPSSFAPTLPAVKALAPETAEVGPSDSGSDQITYSEPRDGLPPKLPHAERVPAVSTSCLGLAVPRPRYHLMKQLWSSLESWPNAEQQNKFVMFKMEKLSTIMKMATWLQFFCQVTFALRGGFSLISLHAILLASLFTIPTIWGLYKRDYFAVEKLLLARSLLRKIFTYHLHVSSHPPNLVMPLIFVRLPESLSQPVCFQWALAENLGMLVLNCIVPIGVSLYWILPCHILGLLITVGQEIHYRKQYLALEKSQ